MNDCPFCDAPSSYCRCGEPAISVLTLVLVGGLCLVGLVLLFTALF